MFSKIIYWLGLAAAVVLVISCFYPWAFYPDIHQTFTGFYSYENQYGKPGRFIVFMTGIVIAFMLVSKVWAKRVNLFVSALLFGYAIKNFVLFSYGYGAFTPEKKPAIWIMLFSAGLVLIASVFPYGRMEKRARIVNSEL